MLARLLLLLVAIAGCASAPVRTEAPPADVVVVRGGLAGLVAARELEKHGLQVHLLEATDRLGGRVATISYGDGLYAESLLCLDVNTGKRVWHFQMVHHGLWDYDLPAAPNLLDVTIGGQRIKAVAQVSKQGFVYVFDRKTGVPVWPIEERPVPQSTAPGERTAKTQPFPLKPPPLSRNSFTAADIATVTPEIEAGCRKLIEGMQLGGPYLPPAYNRLRVQFPGNHGGVNWGGTSFNPELGYLFVSTSELAAFVRDFARKA